jgi:V/A-type H+-transporting ATPase subunit F
MKDYQIAIIGPRDVILGFQALGVTPFPASTGDEALEILQGIRKDIDSPSSDGGPQYALVIIIEDIAEQIPLEEMDKFSRSALPTILALPGVEGSRGIGVNKLRRLAEQAVGSDILG